MDGLVYLLGIPAAILTVGLIGFGIMVWLRTHKQGRTASGQLIMSSEATVVAVRKLGSSRDADREVVLALPGGAESTLLADAADGARLKRGHKGTARWAAGRLIDFTHAH